MNIRHLSSNLRSPGSYLPGLLTFFLLLTLCACGNQRTARIYDNANVLNTSKVQRAASGLPYQVSIYTTSTFQGNKAEFRRIAHQKLQKDPDLIVMAIDTTHRYLYIARGPQVPLSDGAVNQAVSSFTGRFNNGDYTGASIAAVNSLHSSLNAAEQSRNVPLLSPLLACLAIPLLLIAGALLFAAMRHNRRAAGVTTGGGLWNTSRDSQPPEGTYYPPNQGYGPGPNQGYGPPNQSGGINPWLAGGLGAAAGGLAGYELGKRAGERDSGSNADSGADFGSGAGGSFGGGDSGADFGSGAGGSFGDSDFGGDDFAGGGGDF